MDLASMLVREDFFSTFFPSVERYFNEALKTQVSFSFAKNEERCNMVVKPRLSAAASVALSRKAREFYYSEWNIRNSVLKNYLAKAYVFFMTRTGRNFSQFRFTLTPEPENIHDLIIAPNNRSIRIFDYKNNVVGCIIKKGFTSKFFQNQINFRKSHSYDFILPMLSYGEDWFQEPILHGHPLARITNDKLYRRATQEALTNVSLLAQDSLRLIKSGEYIDSLRTHILDMLNLALKKKKITKEQETRQILKFAVQEALLFPKEVPTVLSHGDFQSGNIWVDQQEKVWIYDWETAGRRSLWYDTCVLAYSLRRHYGWKDFLETGNPTQIQSCDKEYSCEDNRGIKGIVLLEDLIFYLEDMLELPEDWGSELFDAFILRIATIEKVKQALDRR